MNHILVVKKHLQQHSPICFQCIFILTVLTCLFYHTESTKRLIEPYDLESEMKLEGIAPIDPIISGNSPSFKIAVSYDISLARKKLSYAEIKDFDMQLFDQAYREMVYSHPHRFVTSIGIPIGTHMRENKCQLQLIIDENQKSDEVECSDLIDNDFARFTFNEPIKPGIHSAELLSTAKTLDNGISPYVSKDAYGSYWIRAYSWPENKSMLAHLISWALASPWLGFLYTLCILCVLFSAFFIRQTNSYSFACLAILLYISNILITKPMSGHDETAHLTMFFHQANGLKTSPQDQKGFYRETQEYMHEGDFYRLHNTDPVDPEQCPHTVIGDCGETHRPSSLYKRYSQLFQLHFFQLTPQLLAWLGRAINLSLTLLLMATTCFLLGRPALRGLSVALIFCGAYLAQLASITNDFPLFISGMAFGIFIGHGISHGIRPLNFVHLLIWVGLYSTLFFDIDQSWILGLPMISACIFITVLSFFRKYKKNIQTSSRARQLVQLLVFISVFIGCFIAIAELRDQISNVNHEWGIVPRTYMQMLLNFVNLTSSETWISISEHMKSFWGTYVWGHTNHSNFFYICLTLGLATTSVLGLNQISMKGIFPKTLAAFAAILMAMHLLVTISIFSWLTRPYDIPALPYVMTAAFAKARFSATSAASILILGLVYLNTIKSKKEKENLFRACLLWVMYMLLYFQPKAYIGDLF